MRFLRPQAPEGAHVEEEVQQADVRERGRGNAPVLPLHHHLLVAHPHVRIRQPVLLQEDNTSTPHQGKSQVKCQVQYCQVQNCMQFLMQILSLEIPQASHNTQFLMYFQACGP